MQITLRSISIALATAVAFVCIGCGGSVSPSSSQSVVITVQPVSQIVPISQTATFSVTATGTGPLSYQWSENGQAIAGATSASYTTPPIALVESGSTTVGTFQVTVRDASSSATSNNATLSAGPRSPKPGDLRYLQFEQVNLPGFMGTYGGASGNLGWVMYSIGNALGTPLWLGSNVTVSNVCEWHFSYYPLPPTMNNMAMYYQEGFLNYTTPAAYLQSVAAPYTVITSMDIQPQAYCQTIGVSWVESPQNAFDQRLEVISPAQIPAQVAQGGRASRIVTAASFDGSGNVYLLSYGWTGDTTTVYETQTYLVPPEQVRSMVTTLAANGYFISAFGGNDANGYILIGARVKGDTLPRATSINGVVAPNAGSAYFTPVVFLWEEYSGQESVFVWEQ
jgi:hypothetical protein